MAETHTKEIAQIMVPSRFAEKSVGELAKMCLAGDKDAWNEFYGRYDKLIINTIELVFLLNGFENVGDSFVEINVSEIHLKIVTGFQRDNLLGKCPDPTGLEQWLKTVAHHAAVTRLIQLCRQKYLPDTIAQTFLIYLDRPIGEDEEYTVGDTIPTDVPLPDVQLITRFRLDIVQVTLEEMEHETNRKQFWLLRLDIISVLPLDSNDIDSLETFSPLSGDEVRETANRINGVVSKKELKRQAALGRAEILRRQIERLHAHLRDALRESIGNQTVGIGKLMKEIARLEAVKSKRLGEGMRIPRPPQKDVGALVGMPEDQVSTNLKRVRKKIYKRVMNRIKPEDEVNYEQGDL